MIDLQPGKSRWAQWRERRRLVRDYDRAVAMDGHPTMLAVDVAPLEPPTDYAHAAYVAHLIAHHHWDVNRARRFVDDHIYTMRGVMS